MFQYPSGKPVAPPAYNAASSAFPQQLWSRPDFHQNPAPSSAIPTEHNHDGRPSFQHAGEMDWVSTMSDVQTNYHHAAQQHGSQTAADMELDAFNRHQNRGGLGVGLGVGVGGAAGGGEEGGGAAGGVGRLVAHFENKAVNPLEQRPFAPPLPPRPVPNPIGNMASSNSRHHQHAPHHTPPVNNMNNFQPNLMFDHLPYDTAPNARGDNMPFNSNRIVSPISTPSEGWGSFPSVQRVTSSNSLSPQPSLQENRVASSIPPSSSARFGSLDNFMSSNRIRRPVTHSPMPDNVHMGPAPIMASPVASSSANQTALAAAAAAAAAAAGGTPGFDIWRPPGSAGPRMDQPPPNSFNPVTTTTTSTSASATDTPFVFSNTYHNAPTNSAGISKPPVPKTPKPNIAAGNQFILELNPAAKVKGRPGRPPKPKPAPPLKPEVKQEPATPDLVDLALGPALPPISESTFSTPMCTNAAPVPLRGPPGIRPSREQVHPEAWEHFRGVIRTLYLEKRKPLKEVIAIMSELYGFNATPKMYKTRFSQWGFVKNNTEEEVKRLLSKKFQRDAEGKVSEFVRNGRVVNLGTYLKRKGVTEYDLVDFETPADLPAHVRCRTPTPPPTPGYLQSPDLVRAQELLVCNMRKAFAHCHQFEADTGASIGWPVTMVWGAGSSDLLLEANFYFEARDADQGGHFLMKAFKQLEQDLKKLSPLGIVELLLGMVHRDARMMTALCKYLAAYSTTNFERSHPLRQIFSCLYEVQQKHGSSTVSELVWGSVPSIAEELENTYLSRHPYVARTWIDLALFHDYVDADRLEKLVSVLRLQLPEVEKEFGANSPDALTLRYAITQALYATSAKPDATRRAAHELWGHLQSIGVVFGIRDAKPNMYCYHSPVKVDPSTKRCRRRYDSGVSILEEHVGVRIQPYFEEDYHGCVHVPDAQEAWSSALDYMGSGKFAF